MIYVIKSYGSLKRMDLNYYMLNQIGYLLLGKLILKRWFKHRNKMKNKRRKGDFKLIDEYKPSGNFIYNESDLLSMENKMKSFT